MTPDQSTNQKGLNDVECTRSDMPRQVEGRPTVLPAPPFMPAHLFPRGYLLPPTPLLNVFLERAIANDPGSIHIAENAALELVNQRCKALTAFAKSPLQH